MQVTNGKSKLTFFSLVFSCFAGLVALLFISGMGRAQDQTIEVVSISVEASELQWSSSFDKIQRVVGRVESAQQAFAGFELNGVIADVFVDDGYTVVKGQPLATLDTQVLASELRQAQASLDRAKAQATLAKSSLTRVQDLVAKRLESQQRLDESQQSLDVAKASVKEAQARLNTIQVNIDKSTLRAPFDAQVIARRLDVGTVVGVGQTVFELMATGDTDVRMPMPADLIKHVNVGQQYVLKANGQQFPAQLVSIGQQRRLATRTIDAVFELQATGDTSVLPGDLLTLDVKVTVNESGAWVPISALSHGVRGLWNVYSVDNNDTSEVTPRAVEVLYSDGQFAFIRGAISSDMLVVVSGTHRLAPGQDVAVKRVTTNDTATRAM